ncbi:MAG: FkbM family methyltransferase [Salinivirgaceae bacterium]|nr:FkbM family methyltransferase [Salinivirgaceae bacterium]
MSNTIRQIAGKVKRVLLSTIIRDKTPETIRREQAIKLGRKMRLRKNGFIFRCDNLKPSFFIPLYKEDYIQQRILTEKKYYEYENLNYICKEWENGKVLNSINNGCILDIGTNIGNHTLYFFFECGIKKAICFEPIKSTFDILHKNVEINGLNEKVELHNVAVGEDSGRSSVSHYDKTNIGSTQISLKEDGEIPVISIDSLNISDEIKLIKIDVEGFELNVIKGCIGTIKRYKPYIMIEIQNENLDFIVSELSKFGYDYIKLGGYNYFFFT